MRWIARMLALPWVALAIQTAFASDLELVEAERVEVPRSYQLDGEVEAVSASTVSAQTSGQVREVLFDVDDVVREGQVIVVIDDTEQKAALAQAQANLERARARRSNADKEYLRIRELFKKNAVSRSAMDKATSDQLAARASVDAAEATLTRSRQQLEYTRVKAPYTGIVTQRLIEVGEMASAGRKLMSGISLEQMRVKVDVPQSMIDAIRRERQATVLVNGGQVPVTRLTVFPMADPATGTFRVRLDLPKNIQGIYPGMYVKVALQVGRRQVLTVPESAVVFRSEVIGVYVADDEGRVRLRHIRIGNRLADGRLVVLSGLDSGERVATDPQAAVRVLKKQRGGRAGNE